MKFDLVFEGGGAKGMVFAGALQAFEAAGHTHGRLLGTSAGAITAALLSVGYTGRDLAEVLDERDGDRSVFAAFMATPEFTTEELQRSVLRDILARVDVPFLPAELEARMDAAILEALMARPTFRNLFSFVELGGWYAAHRMVEWMTAKLDAGTFRGAPRRFGRMTLAEHHAATGSDLSLVASDTTNASLLVLNHRTAPDLPVVWAVRMSMSIPLLWQEVVWREAWGAYRGRAMTGTTVVDGGTLSNFPIELFVSDEDYVAEIMGAPDADHVLGLLLDERLPVPGLPPAPAAAAPALDFGQHRVTQRLQRLVNTVVNARDKMVVDAFDELVVHLPAGGIGTTEFDMSDARRDALLAAGAGAMNAYLAGLAEGRPTDMVWRDPRMAGRMAARILDRSRADR